MQQPKKAAVHGLRRENGLLEMYVTSLSVFWLVLVEVPSIEFLNNINYTTIVLPAISAYVSCTGEKKLGTVACPDKWKDGARNVVRKFSIDGVHEFVIRVL